jgi:antitoxin component YwqK of YwqJK toxin-antitoxin module
VTIKKNYCYYYKSGQLKRECNYVNGKLEGEIIKYHPNGKIKRVDYFEHGRREGESRTYNQDGKLIERITYG